MLTDGGLVVGSECQAISALNSITVQFGNAESVFSVNSEINSWRLYEATNTCLFEDYCMSVLYKIVYVVQCRSSLQISSSASNNFVRIYTLTATLHPRPCCANLHADSHTSPKAMLC